ncbi:MAG TPA: IPT/TIG domain-containing protein [Puia sp.]|nr:IPT/TIG domain-containing protein [Puia sp.]
MHTKNQTAILLTIIFLVLTSEFFIGCKKDQVSKIPITITSISPDSGAYSTVVTIMGTGFSSSAGNNTVKFNGVTTTVQSASSTSLTVIVPKGSGTGAVTVSANNQIATGPQFEYLYTYSLSLLAGNGQAGYHDGNGNAASFNGINDLAADVQGNIYVADYENGRIRKVTAAGVVTTLAGGDSSGTADGAGSAAGFTSPAGLTFDKDGNLLVADIVINKIRKVTPAGVVTTIAGNGIAGHVNGNVSAAEFNYPSDVVADANGNIYVTEYFGYDVRLISAGGVVSTIAGDTLAGFADGQGTAALFDGPTSLIRDNQGNIYVVDYLNQHLRKVTPSGMVTSVKTIFDVFGLAIDTYNNIYMAAIGSVIKLSPDGSVHMVVDNSSNPNLEFYAITIDPQGVFYVAGSDNNLYKILAQ